MGGDCYSKIKHTPSFSFNRRRIQEWRHPSSNPDVRRSSALKILPGCVFIQFGYLLACFQHYFPCNRNIKAGSSRQSTPANFTSRRAPRAPCLCLLLPRPGCLSSNAGLSPARSRCRDTISQAEHDRDGSREARPSPGAPAPPPLGAGPAASAGWEQRGAGGWGPAAGGDGASLPQALSRHAALFLPFPHLNPPPAGLWPGAAGGAALRALTAPCEVPTGPREEYKLQDAGCRFEACCTMATTSVDGSGSYEKGQVELSQSSRSSVFDYSEDTFESFSEEEAACCQHESKPPEPCCSVEDVESSAVSDGLESMSYLAGQNHTDEQSEVVGSVAAERYFMRKWMDVLKNKEAVIKQGNSVLKTHSEVTELPDEELDALRTFCTDKIRRMHQGLISKQASGVRSRKLQHGFMSKKSETSDLNCMVPGQLMNRIRLKNIRETINQVTEAQVHQSSQCPDCKKKKAELAEIAFLRQKKALVERALLQEKLEEQIYSRDALTLIGETLRSFPKLSEDPRSLWQRIKDKAEGRTELCERPKSSALLEG